VTLLSTGVPELDRRLGGGIPAGSLVALTAPPDSQSELLFAELARMQRVLYASTVRADESEIHGWLDPPGEDADVHVTHLDAKQFLSSPEGFVEDLPGESCLVVDPIDELEAGPREEYVDALNALKRGLRGADSVAFVHCLAGDRVPDLRSLTLKRADHVWRIRQTVDADELTTALFIPKSRAGETVTEALTMELTDRVRIDTSRNIA